MIYAEIIHNTHYREHHTGSRRGYISRMADVRKLPVELVKSGRYAGLYRVALPRWDTSQYVNVVYFEKI